MFNVVVWNYLPPRRQRPKPALPPWKGNRIDILA
jgi:hypothetical protein